MVASEHENAWPYGLSQLIYFDDRLQLRNEIYCQLLRQVTNNGDAILLQRAWELLAMVCSVFPPNHYLLKYVASFLWQLAANRARSQSGA
jgi:hypothetical protein